jgi:hypothetical protein
VHERLNTYVPGITTAPVLFWISKEALPAVLRLPTLTIPPLAVIGPALADQAAAGVTAKPPLPEKTAGVHGAGSGVSATTHVSPLGALTVVTPVPGSVMLTVVGPDGPPGPLHVTVKVYVPAICVAPVFFRISKGILSTVLRFATVTTLFPASGPTVADHGGPPTTGALLVKMGAVHGAPSGVSATTQESPWGTLMMVLPGVGKTTVPLQVYGPPDPLHVTVKA